MDSENANKSKKKKTSNIIQICIGVLAVVLAALIIVMMGIVSSIQGTARVVNYAGLVRGKTQRIIKLEISDQPEDGMIQDIEAFVDGLRNGNGELGLVQDQVWGRVTANRNAGKATRYYMDIFCASALPKRSSSVFCMPDSMVPA